MNFNNFNDLIKFINRDLGDFCNKFQYKRKELVGNSKTAGNNQLFGNIKDNWAINKGGGTEVQFHINMDIENSRINYGIAFSTQYVPFATNKVSPLVLLRPFMDAFISLYDQVCESLPKHSFITGSLQDIKNPKYDGFYLFGRSISIDELEKYWHISSEYYEQLLMDLKLQFKPYIQIFEKRNDILKAEINANKKMNISQPKNQILYGPPGTGKTYNTINKAIQIANPEFNLKQDRSEIKKEYDRLVNEDQIVFTTFHQSMSYEDFVEGIKPISRNGQVEYEVIPGLFKAICLKAEENALKVEGKGDFELVFEKLQQSWQENVEMKFPLKTEGKDFTITEFTDTSIRFKKASGGEGHTLSISTLRDFYYKKKIPKNTGVGIYYPGILNKLKELEGNSNSDIDEVKNYVLIIDEINRGNVSQIFGELITLLEEDKRQGESESLELTLPYSKEKFSVPSNLYVIGTMNTADRSVEALDTALRRRFSFEEMPPKPDLIHEVGKANDGNIEDFALIVLMNTINKRIEKLLDKDHLIGHSYFLKLATLDDLRNAFQNNIIPLLQEYFFGDYGKIGLILGQGFFENEGKQEENNNNIFADFNGFDVDFLSDKPIYKVKDFSKPDSNSDFKKAISILLGEKNV